MHKENQGNESILVLQTFLAVYECQKIWTSSEGTGSILPLFDRRTTYTEVYELSVVPLNPLAIILAPNPTFVSAEEEATN